MEVYSQQPLSFLSAKAWGSKVAGYLEMFSPAKVGLAPNARCIHRPAPSPSSSMQYVCYVHVSKPMEKEKNAHLCV